MESQDIIEQNTSLDYMVKHVFNAKTTNILCSCVDVYVFILI